MCLRLALVATLIGGLIAGVAAAIPESIQSLIDEGQWTEARAQLAAVAEQTDDEAQRDELLFEAERLRRIGLDFRWTGEQMLEGIQETLPDATMEDVDRWREEGWIQHFVIDGEIRYFPRDARNLFRRNPAAQGRREAVMPVLDPENMSDMRKMTSGLEAHVQAIIAEAQGDEDGLVCPERYRVTYTLTVNPGEVPEGETIRCWVVYPREEPHMTDIELLWTDPEEHVVAPPDTPQRSIYLERPSNGDEPTEFQVCYEYTAWGFYREIDPEGIEPYDTESELYRRYTAEEPPHIVFTPEITRLVEEVVGDETNPYLKAERIYAWMDENVPWIGEREYSTIPNISDLCLRRHAGDCGVQAILFITLCRAADVPARWESGWQMEPGSEGLHDWARFYVEPHGWLWSDPTYDYRPQWRGEAAQHFYFGNIDAWRLVANSAFSQEFVPPKEHFRSETVDFQRGEVEWAGGNLFFDQWGYDMEVEHLGRPEGL
ncbi:transglutaminase domain-containing protein [Candidatus Sumerlaeota bacterium]|nr:transglutaminase domain-containing protein [Candidatus Sumerlaeota bacterium]